MLAVQIPIKQSHKTTITKNKNIQHIITLYIQELFHDNIVHAEASAYAH